MVASISDHHGGYTCDGGGLSVGRLMSMRVEKNYELSDPLSPFFFYDIKTLADAAVASQDYFKAFFLLYCSACFWK